MFLFVFFCNQKTAYDMRISDWSSDACSSDLVTLKRIESERAVAGDRGLHAQCQAAIKSVALEHFGVLVEPPVEAVQRMPELGRIMQIGQGSWRVRVCLYVSISVV